MSNFHKPSSSFYKEKYMNFNNQSSPKFIRVDNISSQATKDKENWYFKISLISAYLIVYIEVWQRSYLFYSKVTYRNILNFCKEEKNHMQNFDQKTLDLRTKSDIVISISDKEMKQSHVHTNDYSFGSPSDDIYQESINAFMQTTRPELEIEPTFKRKAKLYNETIGCKRELVYLILFK